MRATVLVAVLGVTASVVPPAFAATADQTGTSRSPNVALAQAKQPAPTPRRDNVGTVPVTSNAEAVARRRSTPPVSSPEAHPTAVTAADAKTAHALAAERHEPVEITSMRTETSSTLAQPGGTMTLEAYAAPIRLKDGAGWRDVDTSLVFDGDHVRPRGAKAGVRFSAGGRGEAASLKSGDRRFAVEWPTALPVPTLSGDTATYRNVLPGVDLTLRATRLGYAQHLVVREKPTEPLVVRLPVRLTGLRLRQQSGGELALVDVKGNPVVQATRPEMWGAAVDPRSAEPTQQAPVTTKLVGEHGSTVIELRPDPAFLAAAKYPVTIDPNPALTNVGDSWVMTSYLYTSQHGSTELKSGTYDSGGHIARSLIKFDMGPVMGKDIISSTLKLYNWHSYSCNNGRQTDVRRLTQGWTPSTVWSNKPESTTLNMGFATFAHGYEGVCADAWGSFTNLGAMVESWAAGTANHGMEIRANNEGDSYSWRKFYSANHGTYVPQLTVNYSSPPNAPTSLSPSSVSTVNTLTPSLSAVVSDPDGGTVRGIFDVYNNATGAVVVTGGLGSAVSSGSRSSYPIPSGKLAYGTTYKWRVRTRDAASVYSGYAPSSGYYTFTTASAVTVPSARRSTSYPATAARPSPGNRPRATAARPSRRTSSTSTRTRACRRRRARAHPSTSRTATRRSARQ